jgi:RNA polymerase sigma-70 factor (ECF subfamily)
MENEKFEQSMETYFKTVFRVSLGYVKNIHDAQDITQNVFFKLYRHRKGFADDEAEKAWLIRTAINESKDLLKSSWRKNRGDLDESLVAPENGDLGVYEYVKQLKPAYRTVIYLYYYEGYSTKECADILKKPISTVKMQLQRSRKYLKEIIESEGGIYDTQYPQYQGNV